MALYQNGTQIASQTLTGNTICAGETAAVSSGALQTVFDGLDSETVYTVKVYAESPVGRSDTAVLTAATLEKETEIETETETTAPLETETESEQESETETTAPAETETESEQQTETQKQTQKTTEAPKSGTTNGGSTPKTGDNTNIWLWLFLLMASGALLSKDAFRRRTTGGKKQL